MKAYGHLLPWVAILGSAPGASPAGGHRTRTPITHQRPIIEDFLVFGSMLDTLLAGESLPTRLARQRNCRGRRLIYDYALAIRSALPRRQVLGTGRSSHNRQYVNSRRLLSLFIGGIVTGWPQRSACRTESSRGNPVDPARFAVQRAGSHAHQAC